MAAETAKKAAAVADKAVEGDAAELRGAGAARGTKERPRGNKAKKARQQADLDAAAKKAGEAAKSVEEKEEEEEDKAACADEDVFWQHLVWGAYRSRKRRGED
jgi:hypothetical protein